MNFVRFVLVFALGLCNPIVAKALMVVDFDNMARDSNGFVWQDIYPVGPTLNLAGGFLIETCGYSGRCGSGNLMVAGRNNIYQADIGGATLIPAPYSDIVVKLSRADRKPFDFYSIDIAGFNGDGGAVAFTFYSPDYTTELRVLSGPDPVLQTFDLDKLNLEAVFMSTYAAGMGQFDNLVLDLYSAPSDVPEPSTPMLWLVSALCAIGMAFKESSASHATAKPHRQC